MRLFRSQSAKFLAATSLAACTLFAGTSAIAAPNTRGKNAATAASSPTAPDQSSAKAADPNMLIASVNGQKITLGDVQRAAAALPPSLHQLKANMLVPLLVNQLVDQKVIQIMAEKERLQDKPAVKAAMASAAANVLQNAYLEQKVAPKITDEALKAYYQEHYASRKPEQEVHARHILVNSEAQAQDIIKQLDHGADFGKLAASLSSDKASAAQNGGDLGWFKRTDMIPAFSDAAFSMKPNTVSQKPIHTQYGWHVIQVLGTRTAPVPTFEQERDHIRNELIRQEIRKVIENAQKQVKIVRYGADGKPVTPPKAK